MDENMNDSSIKKPVEYHVPDGHIVVTITPIYVNGHSNRSYEEIHNTTSPIFFCELNKDTKVMKFKSHKFVRDIRNILKTDNNKDFKYGILNALMLELSLPHLDVKFGSFMIELHSIKLIENHKNQDDAMFDYFNVLRQATENVESMSKKTSDDKSFLNKTYNNLTKMINDVRINENKTVQQLTYECIGHTGHGILNSYDINCSTTIEFDVSSLDFTKIINIEIEINNDLWDVINKSIKQYLSYRQYSLSLLNKPL